MLVVHSVPRSTNPSHLFQSVRGSVFSRANVLVLLLKYVRVCTLAAAGLELRRWGSSRARQMTECAALLQQAAVPHNQKQSDFFSVDLLVCDALVSEGSSKHPQPTGRFHLLCGLMVPGTGHVGNVGRYGLDLPHELISNPAVVLQQCH